MRLKHILVMLLASTLALTAAHSQGNSAHKSFIGSYAVKQLENDKEVLAPRPHDVKGELAELVSKQNALVNDVRYLEKAQADLIPTNYHWNTWNVTGQSQEIKTLFGRNIFTTAFVGTPNRTNSFNVWVIPPKQVPADTELTLAFATSSERGEDQNGEVSRAVTVSCSEINSDKPYWEKSIPLTEQIRFYQYKFQVPKSASKNFRILFKITRIEGRVKIGDLHLFYDEGLSRARAKISPAEIEHRIDAYRKANLHILVLDKSNKPVPKVNVSVEQKRHEFLFGATIFNLAPGDKSASQLNYQKQFLQLFNWGGLSTFMIDINSTEGKQKYDWVFEQIKWFKEHGIEPYANELIGTDNLPAWLKKPRADTSSILRTEITNSVKTLSPQVPTIVVASDLIKAVRKPLPQDAISNWVQTLPQQNRDIDDRPMNALELILTWAHNAKSNENTKFIYNMYDSHFIDLFLNYKETFGHTPNAIGLCRWNCPGEYEDLANLWKSCEECKNINKPLPVYATRIAVLNGNIKGEKAQAEYIVNLYRVLFSHSSVRAINYDLLRDWPYDQPRGLVRSNGTPKLAYYKLLDLIHKEWWTNEKGTTDSTGTFTTKAFYGDYLITVKDSSGRTVSKTFKVSKDVERDKQLVISL